MSKMVQAGIVAGLIVACAALIMWNMWGGALMALGFSMSQYNPFERVGSGSASVATSGVGKEAPGVGDLGIVDSVMRHNTVAAVDTLTGLTYAKGVASANIKVPTDANFISRIDITASADFSNTATNGLYCTTMVQIQGNALRDAGWQRWAGPALASFGKTAGSGCCRSRVVTYATKIPVKGGNEMAVYGEMFGSDVGDLSLAAYFVFTKSGRSFGIADSDVREGDLTTKDTDVVLTALGADTLGTFTVPAGMNVIPAFLTVMAPGAGADYASQTRSMVAFSLGGNAMGTSGFYHFPSETQSLATVTTGLALVSSEPEIVNLGLPVKPGNTIEFHAMMIEEDPGLISVMAGILYGTTEGI